VAYQLFVNVGSGDIEISGSTPFTIRAKTHDWFYITIPQKPQNLAAVVLTNPKRVQLTWTPTSWSMMVIQRSIGIGTNPVDFDSAYGYYGSYVDNAVSTGTTYTYRVRTSLSAQLWGLTPKGPLYSSIVTITP
jgi:hypothetical protein